MNEEGKGRERGREGREGKERSWTGGRGWLRHSLGSGGTVKWEREGRETGRRKQGGRKRKRTDQSRLGTFRHSLLPFLRGTVRWHYQSIVS